jgi:LacI family transcriptional regulator
MLESPGAAVKVLVRHGERDRRLPTIGDVARAAGVSTATVSRVLNDHPYVSSGVAARVRKSMKDLDYQPSRAARTLRTRKSRVWSLILADIGNPFFSDTIRGIEKVAYESGYSLILANTGESAQKEHSNIQLAVAENVSGIILVPAKPRGSDLALLKANDIPVVTLDRRIAGGGLDGVLTDHIGGSRLAVDHLLQNGYERIACITGPADRTSGVERLAGYLAALAARGIAEEPGYARHSDFGEEGGYKEMASLLRLTPRPDAVFVANNVMTVGALRAIVDAGLRIPDDVAVVGFDEMSWSRLLNPPLTTVAQPSYDLGLEVARLLLSRLGGYDGAAREVVLAADLHVRDSSTARPKERVRHTTTR